MTKEETKIRRARPTPAIEFRNRQKELSRKAFTLTGLMAAAAASIIVILSVGFVLADNSRAWRRSYENANCDVVVDGFIARRAFDSVIRKASSTGYELSVDGDWVTIQYYNDPENPDTTSPDRYATFKHVGTTCDVEIGTIDPEGDPTGIINTRTICNNVSECTFKIEGRSVQMILVLDDGKRTDTLVACGYMHNSSE